jgi:hypothetical protein
MSLVDESAPQEQVDEPAKNSGRSRASAAKQPAVSEANANPFTDIDPFAIPKDADADLLSDDDGPAPEQEKPEDASRANKRIRTLVSEVKRQRDELQSSKSRLGEYENWSQQAYHQYNQLSQQHHSQQIEMARLQAKVEAMELRGGRPEEPEDEVSSFRRKVIEEANQKAGEMWSPQLQEATNRLQALEARLESERQQQAEQQQRAQYEAATQQALERNILPFLTSDGAQQLGHRLGSLIIQEAVMTQTDLDSAAKNVRNFMFQVARDVMNKRTSGDGQRLAAAKQSPPPAPKGRLDATTDDYPDYKTLRKHKFKNYVEWEMRGRPKLT